MYMKIFVKTKWLLPILIVGLAILLVVQSPSSASDQSLAEAELSTKAAGELELVAASPEGPEAPEAEFDDTAHGTY